jgi:hypothetical protein
MRQHLYKKETNYWQHSNACWCRSECGRPTDEELRRDFHFADSTYKWFDTDEQTVPLTYTTRRRREILKALDDLYRENPALVRDWMKEIQAMESGDWLS